MSTIELSNRIKELRELRRMEEELETEIAELYQQYSKQTESRRFIVA